MTIDSSELLLCLPAKLQEHPRAEAFASYALDSAARWAQMAAATPAETAAGQRDKLRGVEVAANRMQNALQPLQEASDAYESLASDFEYLAIRAREIGTPAAGRPKVPALPQDVPNLCDLLARIEGDLQTLRIVCNYTVGEMNDLAQSAPKFHERGLVRAVAEHYRLQFGELPPQRGWFADQFIDALAGAVKMKIGWKVVGDVVKSMK